jgi:hypothetical protein
MKAQLPPPQPPTPPTPAPAPAAAPAPAPNAIFIPPYQQIFLDKAEKDF